MFSRASSRSYICFKCRRNLGLLNSSSWLANESSNSPIYKRWQSTSANAARDDAEDDDLPLFRQVDIHNPPDDPSSTRKERPAYRHWTPAPTAPLSGKVLGKPSEVLILPHGGRRKKRRQSESQKGDDDEPIPSAEHDAPRKSILETIANEGKPVTPEEVSQSMDNLRQELGVSGSLLDDETWRTCRKALSSAFNTAQLQVYIFQTLSPTLSKEERHEKLRYGKHVSKKQLADVIINQIWRFERGDERHGEITQSIEMEPDYRSLLLKCDKISKLHLKDVKVEEHRRGFKIIGSHLDDVVAAKGALNNLRQQIVSQPYLLPTDPDELRSLLERHPVVVHLDRVERSRTAYAFSHHDLANFERDFIIQRQKPQKLAKPYTFQSQSAGRHLEVPVYIQSAGLAVKEYSRTVSEELPDEQKNSFTPSYQSSAALDNLLEVLEEKILNVPVAGSQFQLSTGAIRTVGSLSSEFSIEFGQFLTPSKIHEQSRDDTPQMQPAFQLQLPLLAQFLAQQQSFDCPESSLIKALPRRQIGTPKLLRISFKSKHPEKYPYIEIHANYDQSSSIRVHEIAFHFEQLTNPVKLTTMPADFQISRHDKLQIFRKGVGFQEQYTPLMVSFLQKLVAKDRHNERGLGLSPTLELDLSCLNTISDSGDTETNKGLHKKVKYALDQVDWLDRAVYHTHNQSPFLVEYLSYTPLRESSIKEPRQVVRLVELPLLHFFKIAEEKYLDGTLRRDADQLAERGLTASSEQKPTSSDSDPPSWSPHPIGNNRDSFGQFVKTGLDFVASYDAFVKTKTKEIAARHPPIEEPSQ